MANKIITAVQQLSENVIIENSNNVVCIDTQYNRIGVKTSSPQHEIDVSGTISTNFLNFKNNGTTNDIIYDNDFLKFQKSIYISHDISVNNKIDCSLLVTNDLSSINIDISNANINFITNNTLECSNILVNDISIINILNLNTINSFNSNKTISFSDCSLNSINSIDCSSITTNNFFGDASFNGSHYTFLSDISFIGNCDFSGNVFIDASLVISDTASTNRLTVRSDDRLKHNEKNIINGLQIIRQLEPQIYQKTKNFKEPDFSGILNEAYILEAGLIAQDVEKINDLSFCVTIGNESVPYSLNYNNIFVYGLAALKELDEKIVNNVNLNKTSNLGNIEKFIQNQTIIIESLNNKINYLEKEINILKNKNIK